MQIRQSLRRILAVVSIATLTGAIAIAPFDATPASAVTYTPTLTTWTSATSGTLGSVTVTATTNSPSTGTADLSGASFDPAGSATAPMLQFAAPDAVLFSFSASVADPVLYFRFMRGSSVGGPATIAFSTIGSACSWTIRSGFTGASFNGAVLTLPSGFSNGIIQCTGSPTGIEWVPAGGQTGGSQSTVTVGVLAPVTPSTTATTAPASTTTASTSTTAAAPTSTTTVTGDPVVPTFTG